MKPGALSWRNLTGHPGRTAALITLVALLALSLFCGAVMMTGLRSGLNSLEARLGADIIVLPAAARSKVDIETLYLQGTIGYYYMKAENLEKIRAMEAVETASPQLFLASLRASCCTVPIQVIGIDQETDFTIQPWIAESYGRPLGDFELAVGSRVSTPLGETLRIYGQDCVAVARLAQTGTGLDTGVYCTMETLRALLEAARGLNHDLKIDGDPAEVISAVYVKLKPGYDPEDVRGDIVLKVRKTIASATRSVISGVEDSMGGISSMISLMMAAIWGLAFVILVITFLMLGNERKREFAALRLIGMTRRGLAAMTLREALLVSLLGGILGVGLGALGMYSFRGLIESRLNLPFLMPAGIRAVGYGALTLAVVILAGALASAWAAWRVSRVDPGTTLREAN